MSKLKKPSKKTTEKTARDAAALMLQLMDRTEMACDPFVMLLELTPGALPEWVDDDDADRIISERRDVPLNAAFTRFASDPVLREQIAAALLRATGLAPATAAIDPDNETIRRFFLRPQPTYTVREFADMFRETYSTIIEAVDNVELAEVNGLPLKEGDRLLMGPAGAFGEDSLVTWHMASTYVLDKFNAAALEDALGADFADCLPEGYRTETVTLRLPQHAISVLRDGYDLESELGTFPDAFTPPGLRETAHAG